MKVLLINILFILSINIAYSQVGGFNTYKFLNLANTARMSAMGDHVVSIFDEDITMAQENPALLNDKMYGNLSISHKFLFADISSNNLAYGFKIGKWNIPILTGIQYVDYGEADMTDLYGDKYGKITGSDLAFVLGTSYKLYDNLSIGINSKFIYSSLASYNSFGIAVDIAAAYFIPEKNISAGFVIKNLGGQITKYADSRESAPLNIVFGITKRLQHLPFQFSVTAHHLNRWNMLYDDPNEENNILIIGESVDKSKLSVFSDNFFRHINFSGEFLLGKGGNGPLRLRIAYNYMKSKEMKVSTYRSFAGFSFGVGLKIKKFRIDYAYSIYHIAGGKSHFTISTNLSEFGKKL